MNILLVEDETRVADFIRRGLAADGWSVDHVEPCESEKNVCFITGNEPCWFSFQCCLVLMSRRRRPLVVGVGMR